MLWHLDVYYAELLPIAMRWQIEPPEVSLLKIYRSIERRLKNHYIGGVSMLCFLVPMTIQNSRKFFFDRKISTLWIVANRSDHRMGHHPIRSHFLARFVNEILNWKIKWQYLNPAFQISNLDWLLLQRTKNVHFSTYPLIFVKNFLKCFTFQLDWIKLRTSASFSNVFFSHVYHKYNTYVLKQSFFYRSIYFCTCNSFAGIGRSAPDLLLRPVMISLLTCSDSTPVL